MTNPTYHMDLIQGTEEWLKARLGILTASQLKNLFPKALAPSKGAVPETLMYRILSERLLGWATDRFQSWDMARGHYEEELALGVYCSEREVVTTCGFVTNDQWGFTIGYSPDALVGDDGLIEVKSATHEFQLRTIFSSMIDGSGMPDEHSIQCQTGLLVTGQKSEAQAELDQLREVLHGSFSVDRVISICFWLVNILRTNQNIPPRPPATIHLIAD